MLVFLNKNLDESCYQNWNIIDYELRQLNDAKIVHLLRIQGHIIM